MERITRDIIRRVITAPEAMARIMQSLDNCYIEVPTPSLEGVAKSVMNRVEEPRGKGLFQDYNRKYDTYRKDHPASSERMKEVWTNMSGGWLMSVFVDGEKPDWTWVHHHAKSLIFSRFPNREKNIRSLASPAQLSPKNLGWSGERVWIVLQAYVGYYGPSVRCPYCQSIYYNPEDQVYSLVAIWIGEGRQLRVADWLIYKQKSE